MRDYIVRAAAMANSEAVDRAQMGSRFGRLDLASQLAVLAVESMGIDFQVERRDRIGICLASGAGSLATDVEYWQAKDAVGGPSPTLFAYTLASAPLGEVAIRYQITGPNLCVIGPDTILEEARDLLDGGTVEGCVCIVCTVVSPAAAALLGRAPEASAWALFLACSGKGYRLRPEIDRDIETVCRLMS